MTERTVHLIAAAHADQTPDAKPTHVDSDGRKWVVVDEWVQPDAALLIASHAPPEARCSLEGDREETLEGLKEIQNEETP